MATVHSPMRTRSQAASLATCSGEVLRTAELGEIRGMSEPSSEVAEQAEQGLQVLFRELREEQLRIREEFSELLRRGDGDRRRQNQLSPSHFVDSAEANSGVAVAGLGNAVVGPSDARGIELGFKLKLDTFDGSVSLREYFCQFDLVARANHWNEASKTVALASSLRGRARSVLESIEDLENLNFAELKSKLELRFGEGSFQNFYTLFTNRKQKFGEDFASFGLELERLARFAYPECPFSVRDKISCAQFISAISDNFVRKTLQLEGVTSLVSAIERAKAIKVIQEESFKRKGGEDVRSWKNFERRNVGNFVNVRNNFDKSKMGYKGSNKGQNFNFKQNGKYGNVQKECWQCGKLGHFRAECPAFGFGERKN